MPPGRDSACPICGSTTLFDHFEDASPVLATLRPEDRPGPDLFRPVILAECRDCGHLFNRRFDPRDLDRMYGDVGLTNLPAHPSMLQRLEDLRAWLPAGALRGAHVVEIGAGGGHFARLLAGSARAVTVFEPCRALTPAMVPEPNIRLVTGYLTADQDLEPIDVVICRQVLEHTQDPRQLLTTIVNKLSADGLVYIEVPRSEYIVDWAAVLDIHLPHVQYFSTAGLVRLAASVGLHPHQMLMIKDGHDVGILFGRRPGDPSRLDLAPSAGRSTEGLGSRLRWCRDRLCHRLLNLDGPAAIYGASLIGERLLSLTPGLDRIVAVFDDSPANAGHALYTDRRQVAVEVPTASRLTEIDTIVIATYLHDLVIAERARRAGFHGTLLTIRTAPLPSNEFGLRSAFE